MVNEPNPGMAKNDSMRRLPIKRKGIVITTVVNMGIRIFSWNAPHLGTEKRPSKRTVVNIMKITFALTVPLAILIHIAPYYHIFGTDKVGSDVFYRSIKSIRTGLVIGSVTTLIVTPFAIFFGVVAGYFGGIIDDLIQYVYSTLASIPSVLLIVPHTISKLYKKHKTDN